MQGISLANSELTVRGLKYDRNWMVTKIDGSFLTQRRLPLLASIRVHLGPDHLHLTNVSGDSISIRLQADSRKEVTVKVWNDQCRAFDEGDRVSHWLTQNLGGDEEGQLRLVRFMETFRREVDREYLRGEDSHTAFSDGFPFLVTSCESLDQLNKNLADSGANQVSMDRFRPNIVIRGLKAFRENYIDYLQSENNTYSLGIRKPCKRCKVTTVNQQTGGIAEPKEPLRTLALMNKVPGLNGAYFGQNATLVAGEGKQVRVGDKVKLLNTI